MGIIKFTDIRGKVINQKISSEIQSLDLSTRNIISIEEDCFEFENFENVETLWLNGNRLTSLPEGVFNGLPNLKRLYLYHNRINYLPKKIFKPLVNLNQLDLSLNRLTFFPEGLLDNLINLKKLELNFNNITSISAGFFKKMRNLEDLVLSNNSLSELPNSLFLGLINLQRLSLSFNYLVSLPSFEYLLDLEELRLDNNPLTEFDLTTLLSCSKLRKIELLNCSSLRKLNMNPIIPHSVLNAHIITNNTNIIEPPDVIVSKGLQSIWDYYKEPKFSTIDEIRDSFGIHKSIIVKKCIICQKPLKTYKPTPIQSIEELSNKINVSYSDAEQVCDSCNDYFDYLGEDVIGV